MKFTHNLLKTTLTSLITVGAVSHTSSMEKRIDPADRERSRTHPSAQIQSGTVNDIRQRFERTATPPTAHNVSIQQRSDNEITGKAQTRSLMERSERDDKGKQIERKTLPALPSTGSATRTHPSVTKGMSRPEKERTGNSAPQQALIPPSRLTAPIMLSHELIVKIFSAPFVAAKTFTGASRSLDLYAVPDKVITPQGLYISHKVTDPVASSYLRLVKEHPNSVAVQDELTPEEGRTCNTLGEGFESIFAAYYLYTENGPKGVRIQFSEADTIGNKIRYARFMAAVSREIRSSS